MAKLSIVAGATSQTVDVFIQDKTKTDGSGLTGLVFNSAGLTCYYNFPRGVSTQVTLATLAAANSAWSSGGFKEIDATNQPGHYRFDVPNAVIAAASGRYVKVVFRGAASMADLPLEIELTGWDNQDAVHGGLSALPNAAAGANGGLPTGDASARVAIQVGTGAGQINSSAGKVPATLAAADVSGNLTADVQTIKTQGVTCAAPVTVLASVGTAATSTAQTGDAYARLGAPAGASVSADVAAVKSDTGTLATRIPGTVQPQTGDAYARLGAPAGASHAADVASVKSDSSGLRTDYTTARAGYLDVLNGIVAAIWGAATRTLTAFGFTTGLTTSQVAAAVWDEPTASHQTAGSTGKALTSASAPTAAQVAAAVWDEPTASHQTAGSTGKALTSASSAGDPWATPLPGSYAAGTAGRIVGGTPNTYTQQGAGDTPFIGR